MLRLIILLLLLITILEEVDAQESSGTKGIPGVIADGRVIELIKEGFVFTEGPVGTADGGLYFTDVRAVPARIFRLRPSGQIELVSENTNRTGGLALDRNGDLLMAESEGRRIARRDNDGHVTLTTDRWEGGHSFMYPNDLIADSYGGIYFTDPGPRPIVPGRKVHVFYLPPGAKEARVINDEVARPNGLTLTNDEKVLIVSDTISEAMVAFDVQPGGMVRNRRLFAKLRDIPAGGPSGADGMAIDSEDRVYVTSLTGIQIFRRDGEYLGTIKTPRQPANLAFSGVDKRTLYITAREGLYRVRLLSRGPERLGK